MKTDRFIVENMKCMGCVNIIKNELSQTDGISEVYIDQVKSEVTVNYQTDKLSYTDIARKLGNIGYPVKS